MLYFGARPAVGELRGCGGLQVGRVVWNVGGEGGEVLSSEGHYILWLPDQQELDEVSQERLQLRVMPHVDGMIVLQLLLGGTKEVVTYH